MFIKKKAFNLFKKSAVLRLKDKKFIVIVDEDDEQPVETKVVEKHEPHVEREVAEEPRVATAPKKQSPKKVVKTEVEEEK